MHILLGLALGVALLYFWLVGWWFARILVFLGLGPLFAIAGFSLGTDMGGALCLGAIFVAPAWIVASLPVYCWRQKLGLTTSNPTWLRRWIAAEFS